MSVGHEMAAHRGQAGDHWRRSMADVSAINDSPITDTVSAS